MSENTGSLTSKHLALLEELERQENVSQRRLARRLGVATGVVNRRIRELVDAGHVRVRDRQVRPYAYDLTEEGRSYLRRLSREHHHDVLGHYRKLQERIRHRLREIRAGGVERLVLYGAGDVMEVCCPIARSMGFQVVGLVDDDPDLHGSVKLDLVVEAPTAILSYCPEAVLITTFRHTSQIQERFAKQVRSRVEVLEL